MMDEAIDGREGHSLVREDLVPFAERLVGRDQQGSPLITGGDQLEQHARFGLILGDVGKVIEDEQIMRSSLAIVLSRASSRRATWSRCTRSVVRANITRHPF